MKRLWIGTGWKMNKTTAEAEEYAVNLCDFVEHDSPRANVFIVPPFTALARVCAVLKDSPVLVGAQNMHWEESGAATGEISPLMLKDCGVQLVELGHSERRSSFGETDFSVNLKVRSALRHGLRPLICVGETAQEKEYGAAKESVARQVRIALHGVSREEAVAVLIAYEPVWAIGEKGVPSEPGYACAMHRAIRHTVEESYDTDIAQQLPVLYGGSVDSNNGAAFLSQADINGLFVGRAAWQVASFVHLIRITGSALEGGK
ncbi:MAG: triose-phosphate isomerase [Chloroflexi bacterium]|nr:triose-phosphate isomerase [Chloroflexota bacterium]